MKEPDNKEPQNDSRDIALLSFLDQLKSDLKAVCDDRTAIRLSLRRCCEHFRAQSGCVAPHLGSYRRPGHHGCRLVS